MIPLVLLIMANYVDPTPHPEHVRVRLPDDYPAWKITYEYRDSVRLGYFYDLRSKAGWELSPWVPDTLLLPYRIDLSLLNFKECRVNAACSCGTAYYFANLGLESWEKAVGKPIVARSVSIEWYPHQETEINPSRLRYDLIFRYGDWINLSKKGVEKIKVNKNVAYRLRAFSHREQLDAEPFLRTERVTKYFIPTRHYDFFIECRDLVYLYDEIWEAMDSLSIVLSLDWRCWLPPYDHIWELEQAVEQTFRVK